MIRRDAGHAVAIAAVVVIVIVVLGLLGWVFWRNFLSPSNGSAITNFEQCKAGAGSKIQLTYPEQCVTTDGRTFTGPSKASDKTKDVSFCSDIEKLCFSYPSDWTLTQGDGSNSGGLPGDQISLVSPDREVTLKLNTNISGLGGTCDESGMKRVTILEPTPIPALTGYKDDYHDDMLQVARVVYTQYSAPDKYVAAIYVSSSPEYIKAGTPTLPCPLGFSQYNDGKNARIAEESESIGAFSFGYSGALEGARYGTEKDAVDAFATDNYKEAAAILASLHYN